MESITVSPDLLLVVAAAALSLFFTYVPGLNTWYAGKSSEIKSLIMAGIILLALAIMFIMQCFGLMDTNLQCTTRGIVDAVWLYVLALAANQGVYSISPQPKAVLEAKSSR